MYMYILVQVTLIQCHCSSLKKSCQVIILGLKWWFSKPTCFILSWLYSRYMPTKNLPLKSFWICKEILYSVAHSLQQQQSFTDKNCVCIEIDNYMLLVGMAEPLGGSFSSSRSKHSNLLETNTHQSHSFVNLYIPITSPMYNNTCSSACTELLCYLYLLHTHIHSSVNVRQLHQVVHLSLSQGGHRCSWTSQYNNLMTLQKCWV